MESVLEQATRRERIVQLVVMTDGQVTNSDDVIDAVRRRSEHVRVFTFGIGRGASHHLVRGLARAGGGTAEFVYPGERIEPKVVRLFRRALSPALTDVHLDWGGMTVTAVPATVGPLFADEPLRVYGLMNQIGSGTVTLQARGASGPMSWSLDVRAADVIDGATVGTLAARARIREIEEGGAWSAERGSRQRERRQDRAVSEIVALATEFGLASRETSWVAVQQREVPLTEEATLRRVPVAITSGWSGRDALIAGAQLSLHSIRLGESDLGFDAVAELRSSIEHRVVPAVSKAMARAARPGASRVESVLGLFGGSRAQTSGGDSTRAVPGSSSTRVLDRLVAQQRADGSWDLTPELADVLGVSLSDLIAAMAGASGDPDEARRALATAIALTFLARHELSSHGEWELLAAKATRWLTKVTAVPTSGRSWMELARSLLL
jgi:von Willebrand factor type A domain